VGEVLGRVNPLDRDAGTSASVVQGVCGGAHIFRVHNVRAMFDTVKTVHEVLKV